MNVKVNVRLEPHLPDSFKKRVDLGVLTATDEWQTLDMPLSGGKNIPEFLRAVAEETPAEFKLVFGNGGPITGFRAGDTILIDDIAISTALPE